MIKLTVLIGFLFCLTSSFSQKYNFLVKENEVYYEKKYIFKDESKEELNTKVIKFLAINNFPVRFADSTEIYATGNFKTKYRGWFLFFFNTTLYDCIYDLKFVVNDGEIKCISNNFVLVFQFLKITSHSFFSSNQNANNLGFGMSKSTTKIPTSIPRKYLNRYYQRGKTQRKHKLFVDVNNKMLHLENNFIITLNEFPKTIKKSSKSKINLEACLVPENNNLDKYDLLKKIKDLNDSGAITNEEWKKEKSKILKNEEELEKAKAFNNLIKEAKVKVDKNEYKKAKEILLKTKLIKKSASIDSLEIQINSIIEHISNKNLERFHEYNKLKENLQFPIKIEDSVSNKLKSFWNTYQNTFDNCLNYLKKKNNEILKVIKDNINFDTLKNEFKMTEYWNEEDEKSLNEIKELKTKITYYYYFIDKVNIAIENKDKKTLRNFDKYNKYIDIINGFVLSD